MTIFFFCIRSWLHSNHWFSLQCKTYSLSFPCLFPCPSQTQALILCLFWLLSLILESSISLCQTFMSNLGIFQSFHRLSLWEFTFPRCSAQAKILPVSSHILLIIPLTCPVLSPKSALVICSAIVLSFPGFSWNLYQCQLVVLN